MQQTSTISTRLFSLALASLFLLPAVSAAQSDPTVTFGVKAGVNAANLKADSDPDLKRLWGAVAGVFLGKNVNDNFSMQLEGLFSQRGARDNSEIVPEKIKLTYLDVPLLFRFGSTSANETRFHVFTGPQVSFKLKSELVDDNGLAFDLNDEVKNYDFGWTLGAGVEQGRFSLDARYTLGLMNINKFTPTDKVKNRTFTALVGVRLK